MQVSNEIISRCCAAIKLPEVFSPNVTNVSAVLQQCIEAGGKWKALYQQTAAAVTAKSARPWDFSESPIFAHVDAFIQRCADLLEVCFTCLYSRTSLYRSPITQQKSTGIELGPAQRTPSSAVGYGLRTGNFDWYREMTDVEKTGMKRFYCMLFLFQ